MKLPPLSGKVIGAAIEVHRQLGPGLLESVYQQCLAEELTALRLHHQREAPVPIRYKGQILECGFRADFIVEDQVMVELKSADRILPIHKSQLLTYMRLTELEIGLLMNFNVNRLADGVRAFHGLHVNSKSV